MKKVSVIIVLSILLLLAIGYIGYDFYSEARSKEQISIYQSGAQDGYEQAVSQMFQQAATCQQIPLVVRNRTLNIVAVECLQSQTPTVE